MIAGLGLAGGAVGLVSGFGFATGLFDTPSQTARWLAMALVASFVIAVGLGSWKYFRTVDEMEIDANLWAGLIGINYYAVLYMSWWALAFADVVPPVDGEAVFLTTMGVALVTFLIKRFR